MANQLEVRSIPISEIGNDQRVLSKPDHEYWKGNEPDAVAVATSSLRKIILLAFALGGYNREFIRTVPFLEHMPFDPTTATTPLELQQLLEKHIPNGDAELKESVYVGEFRGISVYAVPQQGETADNDDPLLQSINKVIDVQNSLNSKRVIIVGSDTVGLINGEHLGKPRYFAHQVGRFERGALDVDFRNPDEVNEYCQAYLLQFYSSDTEIIHNNAVFATKLSDGDVQTTDQETSLTQTVQDVQQQLDRVIVSLDAGGGGLFQQFFDWIGAIEEQLSDALMREVIAQLPEEQRPWAVLTHILGMPAWSLPEVFEELANRKQFRIA